MTSFGRQFEFHDVIYHIPHSNAEVDGVTSFLQLLDFQNVCKNTHFSLNKSCGKF